MTKRQQRWLFSTLASLLVLVAPLVWQAVTGNQPSSALSPSSSPPVVLGESTSPTPVVIASPSGQLETAAISRVVDGDTVKLSDGRTVRYIGIDTPETKHPTKPDGCFGAAASQRNTELVLNQVVQLETDVSQTDRYGRLLRYVWLNGRLLNEQLVTEGYALASSYPPDVKYQAQLQAAETTARAANVGLWSACP